MSYQSPENPTPTVQVKEVALQEQASAGKVLAVAGLAGAALAAVGAMLAQKEEQPASKTDQARDYLRSALENAQKKDLSMMSKKDRKKLAKDLKKNRKEASKKTEAGIEQVRQRTNESADIARREFGSFLSTLKGGGKDLERLAEEFAESTLMSKLKEFGDEAREIAEQGKIKGADVAEKAQSNLIPQVKQAAEKAQSDLIPQVKDAAHQASESGKEHLEDLKKKAKKEYIPNAQKATEDLQTQAQHVAEKVEEDLGHARENVSGKSKEASEAVKRGGRETRSFLLWLSLAGILVFTVFLDEDQQKRLKEISMEVFGEARDMYSDMRGDAENK